MSKIKLTGNASGTGVLTVTAPNTSTDRTITLPDSTGTILDSTSTLDATKLSGALPALDGSSLTGLSSFDPDGAVTINDSGADVNFRIESNSNANQLFVDGGNGRVGIGTGSPDKELELQKDHNGQTTMQIQNDTAGTGAMAQLRVRTNSSLGILASIDDGYTSAGSYQAGTTSLIAADNCTGGLVLGTEGNHPVLFYQSQSERMRLETNTLFWGMTSKTQAISTGAAMYFAKTGSTNKWATLFIGHNSQQMHGIVLKDWNNGGTQIQFIDDGDNSIGHIYTNSSTTFYTTSSDYRLKENVVPMTGSINRLKELKPSKFNFIADADTTVDGFLAHEVSDTVPEAISGTKDGMTTEVLYTEDDELPEGKNIGDVKEPSVIDPQSIDQSKLVPLLTSALQEAVAKIEELTTRIETLEAN